MSATTRILGDLLHEYHESKSNGVLFVGVKQKSENLIRIFFQDGQIRHVSYGTCSGSDCLDIIECYEFTTAYFVKDMKASVVSANMPSTPKIIEQFRRSGRSVLVS